MEVLLSLLSHCSFYGFSKENRNRGGRILLAGGFAPWAQPGECAEQGEAFAILGQIILCCGKLSCVLQDV